MSSLPIIEVQQLVKSFHQQCVVNGIDLKIHKGDLVALIGPSGCGKSTLLRCLNGLESIDSGSIHFHDIRLESEKDIGKKEFQKRSLAVRQKVGMVFQSFNLFPHWTVNENLINPPMIVKKIDLQTAQQRADRLLEKVGLSSHKNQYPERLSGGQQQRAAIARALAMNPDIILYDEPTSALDPTLVAEVLRVMKNLDEEGLTQIVVTHEMRFAQEVADVIVFLEGGKIVEMGPPEQIFSNPKSEKTRQYLRNFL